MAVAKSQNKIRKDAGGANKKEKRSGINIDLSDPNVQLLAGFLVVLGIIGILICLFSVFINTEFKKQGELIKQ